MEVQEEGKEAQEEAVHIDGLHFSIGLLHLSHRHHPIV